MNDKVECESSQVWEGIHRPFNPLYSDLLLEVLLRKSTCMDVSYVLTLFTNRNCILYSFFYLVTEHNDKLVDIQYVLIDQCKYIY